MARVLIYAMASNNDPDNVRCVVPWRADDDFIFFGPCKVPIRKRLRKCYLREDCTHRIPDDDLYIVGLNGGNPRRIRKVVVCGRLAEVMTFAEAHDRLVGPRFTKLRADPMSPLHVCPVLEGGHLVGYDHVSNEHLTGDTWVDDLTSCRSTVRLRGRRITLRPGRTPWEAFDRDCCMLLHNHFFAQGRGIAFDAEAVKILKEAQPDKPGVDAYAVFGKSVGGQVNGLRGQYLEVAGDLANRFLAWLTPRAGEVSSQQQSNKPTHAKTNCAESVSRSHKRVGC